MSGETQTTDHVDHAEKHTLKPTVSPPNTEAVLSGVIALANLFSNCVEAFKLVHPGHRWDKQEQLLIASLGIQQARLLIWGDVVGVSSPPASVTNSAIPKHPSAAYPDLKEPTFFGARDGRLDDTEIRQKVENALSAIVDRSAHSTREEMMEKYGMKPPKRFGAEYQPALDVNRLESFRERYELLKEVAESYAQISTRRNSSITTSSWQILDFAKFGGFIKLIQEKIDELIGLMDAKERVDRGMCMDIRALGWHLSADRARVAHDTSKLKLIQEACKDEYPEYLDAVTHAMNNIERERRENAADYNPYTAPQYAPLNTPREKEKEAPPPSRSGRGSIAAASGESNGAMNGAPPTKENKKHTGLFSSLFKRKSATNIPSGRSLSVADASSTSRPAEPERSMSDIGPFPSSGEPPPGDEQEMRGNVRSKSVGDILDAPINTAEEEETRNRLELLKTGATKEDDEGLGLSSAISAHDQFHGLGRQGTHTQYD